MTNSTSTINSIADLQQERQGHRLAAYLSLAQVDLPHEVTERLRAARHRAVAQRKKAQASTVLVAGHGASAALAWQGDDPVSWWSRIGSVLPLIALVAGLLLINSVQNDSRARELAEVDVALLTDELPVAAFADPGFLQFLKSEH